VTIRTRLFTSFFISIIGIIGIAAFSLATIFMVKDKINELTSKSTPLQVKTLQLQQSVEKLSADLLQLGLSDDPQEVSQISETISTSRQQLEKLHSELNTIKQIPAETAVFAELHDQVLRATDEKIKSVALFRAEASKLNGAMARVDKSLLGLKELISGLISTASRRASSAQKTLNEHLNEKSSVNDLLANVQNYRNEVDHDIELNKKINSIHDIVYSVGVDAKLLDAKTRMIMLTGNQAKLDKITSQAMAVHARIGRNVRQAGKLVKEIKSSGFVDDTISDIVSSVASAGSSLRTISDSQRRLLENMAHLEQSVKKVKEVAHEQGKKSEANVQTTAQEQQHFVKEVSERVDLFKTLLIAVSLATITIALILGLSTTVSINRSLKRMNETIVSIVNTGDFTKTIEIKNQDEFGQTMRAFNNLIDAFTRIIAKVSYSSAQLSGCSRDLSSTAQEIHKTIDVQSSNIAQVSAASVELAQSVSLITGNTSRIAESARDAHEVASSGAEVVAKTVTEVEEIAQTVEESTRLMRTLQEHSQQVGEIVDVIVEITEQTNLLALNAAIEAARAGNHGRGFAVVADEVRKLANNTAEATIGITERVSRIQKDTELAVNGMQASLERVQRGVEYSGQAGAALLHIVEKVSQLQEMTRQIAATTGELSHTSEEISADIIAIEHSSGETVQAAAIIAKESEVLSVMSSELKAEISRFTFEETPAAGDRVTNKSNLTTRPVLTSTSGTNGLAAQPA